MDPRLEALTAGMSPDEIDALAGDITAAAEARGLDPSDENVITHAALAAFDAGDFTPDGIASALDGYEDPVGISQEQAFFEQYPEQREQRIDQETQDTMNAQALAQAGRVEQQLGRPLTTREIDRLDEELVGQLQRHGGFSVDEAAETLDLRPYDEMTSAEQDRTMAQRARDLSDSGGGDLEVPWDVQAGRPDWDAMSSTQQVEYMTARARGAGVEIGEAA